MKISIVTPSYNQAQFLEQTLESVLSQQGVDLEYIVVDGGSTDGSREIIERYADKLAWWCSEPDGGQYEAINKGFSKATGDVLAWLNSSDIYLPWTLQTVGSIFGNHPSVDWITACHKLCIGEGNEFAGYQKMPGFSRNGFLRGMHGSRENTNFIQQETCFWRRSLWEKIGSRIPDTYRYAADFHLWSLMFEHAPLTGVESPLAAFRFHDEQRSKITRYMDEVEEILAEMRASKSLPAHQHSVPVAFLRPTDGDGDFGNWVISVMENDRVIFEEFEAEVALDQKERIIQVLDRECIQREGLIHNLTDHVARLNRNVEDLSSLLQEQNNLKFHLRDNLRRVLRKVGIS